MKSATNTLPAKTLKERFMHALLFEIGGIALATPLAAWAMGSSVSHVGVLAAMLATTAMLWNMVFNFGFETIERRRQWQRTPRIRALHAVSFETGFIAFALPLTMWWMGIGIWEALLLDLGFFLFFLPYTYVYNWAYDAARAYYFRRLQLASV